jgi:N-acetylglucosamine repressor
VILPGLVDPESGVIRYMPHIQVENWGLVEALEKRFKVTCFVGHDIRSLALAEHYFGASQDCEDSILVRVHRGTGAGIISNGRIFIGRNGNVGEIGHIQVDPLGERCHCGILAAWRPSRPTPPSNNACATFLNRATRVN